MYNRLTLAILATLLPVASFAQSAEKYECANGDLIRRVEILYETAGNVPCEVHYYKDQEAPGERQVLWSAGSEAGYCEQKTSEFVDKLRGWGWDCAKSDASTSGDAGSDSGGLTDDVYSGADTDELMDDTDALSAGEEPNEEQQ